MSTSTTAGSAALSYHEPGITTILIVTSFLLLLNIINHILDRITYIGLLGQIFLGIIFGTPGGNILGANLEKVVVDLGYLGLLLLVYEGGLTTSFRSLKANLSLSSCVALTGIAIPIGLSFILMKLTEATPLQAFAAGAALCSTSLGTTFTVMQTSGLNTTRMGVVLTSAAMMDDVVGLVMVQVISNLGSGEFSAVTVVRPVFVSIGFGFGVVFGCRYVVLPLTRLVRGWGAEHAKSRFAKGFSSVESAWIIHVLLLVAMVTGATYAGTSNLFAAYLAGAGISWWHDEMVEDEKKEKTGNQGPAQVQTSQQTEASQEKNGKSGSSPMWKANHRATAGIATFEEYFHQPLQRILKPFFFASIGYSIPITQMFTGTIIWKGLVYTVLMFIGKMVCGLWLVRWNFGKIFGWLPFVKTGQNADSVQEQSTSKNTTPNATIERAPNRVANTSARIYSGPRPSHSSPNPNKPVTLYPPVIVGSAMVARGEIGFLISSLAESTGIFGKEANGSIFLVVTWAIMLCTIIGPIMVGLMVKRLNNVSRGKDDGHQNRILGVWGVSDN